jgi:hypothetical protein
MKLWQAASSAQHGLPSSFMALVVSGVVVCGGGKF